MAALVGRILGVVFMLVGLAACQPEQATLLPTNGAEPLTFTLNEVAIRLVKPAGWTAYIEHSHATLTEHSETMHADGTLNGIVVNIWQHTPPITDTTLAALQQILNAPEVAADNPATTTPKGFEWNGHDAAYYLVDSGDGNVTLVLAVMLADKSGMIAVNISAAKNDMARVRQMLPSLFESFTINQTPLSGQALHDLPLAFDFPT